MIASELVVTPLSKYSWMRARHDAGSPCTIRSSTTSSGIAASAALRSPARHAVPHRPEHLAPAEPLVEGGVHRHVHVGGDREAGGLAHHVGPITRAHEDARHDLALGTAGRVVHDAGHPSHIGRREPVDDRPVGLAAGEAQHALAEPGHEDGR